jgi:predicted dehydrogenase
MIKVGIIGYGIMGKRYHKNLSSEKKFKIIKILRKKKNNNKLFTNSQKDFFKHKIDLYIVATNVETHYQYIKKACLKKKNIIVEKPFVKNAVQARKLKKFKNIKNFFIHHNDVYNLKKINFPKILKSLGKIKEIKFFYGKNQKVNFSKMALDWLPHPLSVLINFFGKPSRLNLQTFNQNNLLVFLNYQNFIAKIHISKNFTIKKKIIHFYGTKKKYTYDGYNQKFNSLKNLINCYSKTKKLNDLSLGIKVTEVIDKIKKKIEKI